MDDATVKENIVNVICKSPAQYHPLPHGTSCFSSDKSQQRNVSIFGRLMQTFPVVVAFNLKYVLRFKLTASATCNRAITKKVHSNIIFSMFYHSLCKSQGIP